MHFYTHQLIQPTPCLLRFIFCIITNFYWVCIGSIGYSKWYAWQNEFDYHSSYLLKPSDATNAVLTWLARVLSWFIQGIVNQICVQPRPCNCLSYTYSGDFKSNTCVYSIMISFHFMLVFPTLYQWEPINQFQERFVNFKLNYTFIRYYSGNRASIMFRCNFSKSYIVNNTARILKAHSHVNSVC